MKVAITPDRLIAIALSIVALTVYAYALPPSYAFWDTGELQTVSVLLGIAHPPGSPAFVLLGWIFSHVIPFQNPAWRVNFMSSCAVAIAVGLAYSTARALRIGRVVAGVCALGFAFTTTTLTYATRAEGHDLVLLFSACALYFASRYERDRGVRDLFCCALSFGLLGATHGVALFFFPALALVVGMRPWPRARTRDALFAIAGGVVLGLLPYAYIVPRSAWLHAHHVDPSLSLGIVGSPFWDYGDPSASPESFWRFVTGAEFHVHSGFAGYVQFDRYFGYANALVKRLGAGYGYAGTVLATIGAAILVFRRGATGKALVLAALAAVPYTEAYADLQDPDRYYLLALWCSAIAIGIAFERIVELILGAPIRIVRVGLAAILIVGFALTGGERSHVFWQRQDDTASSYVAYLRGALPDDAIVLAEWAYASPPAYAAYVENSFGNRITFPSGPTQYIDHYPAWLRGNRPLYIVSFDNDLQIAGYRVSRVSLDRSFYVYQIENK